MGRVVDFPRVPRTPKPLWRTALGEVLRAERLGQERILTEVAAEAGLSPQYLSEVERGRKEPSSEVLAAVTDALGLELFEVVERVGRSLQARREAELAEAARRERLEQEVARAYRLDQPSRHPLLVDLTAADAVDAPESAASTGTVYLLVA